MGPLLHIQIETSSGVPIYRQIMDQVRNYVAAGVLRSGDRLPSIRDLARRLHINPTTITRAYNELHHAGVADLVHGKGVFVASGAARVSRERGEGELRRRAGALAAASRQMGVSYEEAAALLRREMERLGGAGPRRQE